MRTIANILWLVFEGIWMALAYVVAGVVACILIVTIPFGIASFRLAGFALWPFGRTSVRKPTAGVGSAIGNVVWALLFGWWLALAHVVAGIAWCITIIGIPFGVANFKMVPLALLPLGHEVVPIDQVWVAQAPGTPTGPASAATS